MSDSPRLKTTALRSVQGWLVIALCAAQAPARAAVLAEYRVALTQNAATELPPAVVASGVTASAVQPVGGLTAFGINQSPIVLFGGSFWPADAFGTQAFEITVVPTGGAMLHLDSLNIRMYSAPPMTFRLAASNDGFLSTLDQEFSIASESELSVSLSLAALPTTGQPLSLRLFGYYDSEWLDAVIAGFVDSGGWGIRVNGTILNSIVWDGGGTNNAWSTAANWNNDIAPLNDGTANLVFGGNVRLTPSVDTTRNVASIAFNNTAGTFTIGGPRSLTIGSGGITNNDADLQTITANVTLSASQTFTAIAGDLSLNNVNIGSNALTVTGAHRVKLGDLIGTGTITKTGAGILEFAGSVGDGDIVVNANGGVTVFSESQTLSELNIGTGATVTLAAPANSLLPVPEPAAASLLLSGALALCGRRRSRRQLTGPSRSMAVLRVAVKREG